MDTDEEMIQQIMEDKAACDEHVWEHLVIIAGLQKMLSDSTEKKKGPHCGD
jgi:hypothetical protein